MKGSELVVANNSVTKIRIITQISKIMLKKMQRFIHEEEIIGERKKKDRPFKVMLSKSLAQVRPSTEISLLRFSMAKLQRILHTSKKTACFFSPYVLRQDNNYDATKYKFVLMLSIPKNLKNVISNDPIQ
jgi:hypothetical protein